jgi:hypothetical protein
MQEFFNSLLRDPRTLENEQRADSSLTPLRLQPHDAPASALSQDANISVPGKKAAIQDGSGEEVNANPHTAGAGRVEDSSATNTKPFVTYPWMEMKWSL